jgi:hypothetical protein
MQSELVSRVRPDCMSGQTIDKRSTLKNFLNKINAAAILETT